MSKLTEIELALKSIDPAGFQRLCDSLLHARGYRNINPVGLVIGANKVKRGTPDSLVALPNGKYVFAEYTTQQTGVLEKFLGDMAKCFDEAKTGIPSDNIQHFIACHTSVLLPTEDNALIEEGRRRGCLVTVLGLGPISHDLFQRFPGLARDFLGVGLDTGQILSLEEFVATYGKNAVATPLDTDIRFRDDEIIRALNDLENSEILVIAGPPGVGKSRLALEICRRLVEKASDTEARVVLYRGLDLFADVRTYFAHPGDHLVVVDDANRVSGFDHILNLLREQRPDRRVRIIATVRDYALDKVTEDIRPYGAAPILMLTALKDEQIRELLNKDYGIANHLIYERIVEIARGNPRLAVMAARVVIQKDNSQSLANVSAIYDDYFRSIRKDLADLQDAELLRGAGVVAVFRHVDRKNEAQMTVISEAFQVSPERMWAAVQRLHELEVVDLYENEVARISDQVLATYLFHAAFFGQRVLEPSAFFHHAFFPKYRSRLFDALNPTLSAFDGEAITNALRPHLRRVWTQLEASGDEEALLELIHSFGAIEETATLTFLKNRIDVLHAEPAELASLTFKSAASSGLTLWTILGHFRDKELSIAKIALTLALDLLTKRPADVPQALHVLTEQFGMRHTSYLREFEVQAAIIETIWSRLSDSKGNERAVLVRLFVMSAAPLLRTHFQTHEAKGDLAITILTFDVPITQSLIRLRHTIWGIVGKLLDDPLARQSALEFVRDHARDGYRLTDREVLSADASIVIPLLNRALDPAQYAEGAVGRSYLQLLDQQGVTLPEALERQRCDLQARLVGRTYELSALLLDDYGDRRERIEMGWQAYEERKTKELRDYVSDHDLHRLNALIEDCVAIRDDLRAEQAARGEADRPSHKEWQFRRNVLVMLQAVGGRDPSLFVDLIDNYLSVADPLELDPQGILPHLLTSTSPDRAYAILTSHDFARRGLWLTAFFVWLPDEAVSEERLAQLYAHYDRATVFELFRDLDFLAKYEAVDSRVVPKILQALVRKAEADPRIGSVLADAFDGNGAVAGRIGEILGGSPADIALLKQAYFAASLGDPHFDYNAAAFARIIDIDSGFGAEWVDWRYRHSRHGYLSRHDDSRDYSDLWLRDDHAEIIRSILDRIRTHQMWEPFSYADAFITLRKDEPRGEEILRRQKEFFRGWIHESADDVNQMVFVFSRVVSLPHGARRELLAEFLAKNQLFADFEQIPLEPDSWGWSGSQVPLLQQRLEFFESLLPLFDRVELLDHRRQTEERIAGLREYIGREKKRDFLER